MQKFVTLFHPDLEGGKSVSDIGRVPEFVKAHQEGCFRSVFFNSEDQKSLYGPMVLVFAVRRARDLLLEGCEYQGLDIQIESGGRKLPQLPVTSELEKLVNAPDTIIHVNGNIYKPMTEVYGFQQVYDDSVRCIEALKRHGFSQETMAIYATPEEITVEIHGGAIGIEGCEDPGSLYYRLLCQIAGIRDIGGKPAKTEVKTVILQACQKDWRVLLPGSTHPALHRPRVGVGASHFAYGIAAFSDYCGKKRTVQECLQETFSWVKFVLAELPPINGLREKIEKYPLLPWPGSGKVTRKSVAAAGSTAFSGRFQPLKAEIEEGGVRFKEMPPTYHSFSAGLDKSLGGGWTCGGVHVIAGPRESGKAAFLMQQALVSEKKQPVLYVSYEHSLREFIMRAAASASNINLGDQQGLLPIAGAAGDQARAGCAAAVDKLQTQISANLFFSGIEAARSCFEPAEIQQLAAMLPPDSHRLVLIESVSESVFAGEFAQRLHELREIAAAGRLTIIMTVHTPVVCGKRPHYIEEDDIMLLEKFQRFTDSLIVMFSEKVNLRRFVAMVKGQIDAQLVGNLEQKALQLAGGKRYKTDTFNLVRLVHTRTGRRDLLLFLYQPDLAKFFELAAINMSRA